MKVHYTPPPDRFKNARLFLTFLGLALVCNGALSRLFNPNCYTYSDETGEYVPCDDHTASQSIPPEPPG